MAYTKSRIHPYVGGPATDLPGYSRWVANGTLYFEKWGFSARGSMRHRSSFVGEVSGFGANRTLPACPAGNDRRRTDRLRIPAECIARGLSIYLQGLNLTNEPFVTEDGSGNALRIIDYQRYGRRWMLGAIVQVRRLLRRLRLRPAAASATAAAAAGDADLPGRIGDPGDGRLPGSAASATAAARSGAGTRL